MDGGLALESTGRILARRVRRATTPLARALGLLAGPPLGLGEALVIEPARQVHSLGMRAPIDVVFCDRAWRVLHVVSPLRPWRMTRPVLRARRAVELPAGTARGVLPGDRLVPAPGDRGSQVGAGGS